MNQEAKSCYLKSNDKNILTVYLPDQKPVILGRCPETNITDTQCSREQVRLYANYQEYKVFIQQIGKRYCGFNGFKTREELKFIGKHNDCLEILYGKYAYQIEFNPPPVKTLLPEKRDRELDISNEADQSSHKLAKLDSDDAKPADCKEEYEIEEVKKGKKHAKHTDGILKFLMKDKMNVGKSEDKDNTNLDGEQDTWESKDSGSLLIYTRHGVEGRSKIAAYDMDGTLITTRSGLVFPKDTDDWRLLYPEVSGKLKMLHNSGHKIVIFTNQASIGSGRLNAKSFKNKLRNITQRIGVPMQIFVATGSSIYRKPATGMWRQLEENNDSVTIDKGNSFYVGDAAGRQKNWAQGKKKDHSSADRLLALNLGLQFHTPEEHFFGHQPAPYILPTFNPRDLQTVEICTGSNVTSDAQEIILMVGCPGSGKSHFAKKYLSHYEYVNRDGLGSWQRCVSTMEKHLIEKNSVVVDNTNPDAVSRQRYVEVAKKHKVPVRCFVMSTSVEHAKHNNKFRELTDPSHVKVSEVIINSYIKNYKPPSLDEGFAEIVEINFVPNFQNEEHRQLYEMYLLES